MATISRAVVERAGDEGALIPECRALVRILRGSEDSDSVYAQYQVLAATDPSAVGMTATERFQLTPGAIPKLATFFKRAGVMERGDPSDDAAHYDPEQLNGAVLVVDIIHQQLERKNGTTYLVSQWPWGCYWQPSDKRIADAPKEHPQAAAYARFGAAVLARPSAQVANAAPAPANGVSRPSALDTPFAPPPAPNAPRQAAPAGATDDEV